MAARLTDLSLTHRFKFVKLLQNQFIYARVAKFRPSIRPVLVSGGKPPN